VAPPTDFRAAKDVVVAVAHQTAYGSAGSTGSAQQWQVLSCEIDPGFEYLGGVGGLRGTVGSYHPKDNNTKTAHRPKAKLTVLGSPKVAPFIWEYATHGQPTATLAGSDLSEAGDTGSDLSAWSFTGVRPGFNTSADWQLYVKLTDENPTAGSALVQVYSDSGRTALVASGSHANNGTVTLAEQNNSGLSGTVALAAPSANNLSSIVLTLTQVRPALSGVLTRFFTLWCDHGSGRALERVVDCAVEKVMRKSSQAGPVEYAIDLVGSTYTPGTGSGGTFTPALVAGDTEYYAHGTASYTSDTDSGNVAQHALEIEMGIENDLEVVLANSATATAIWKRGVKAYPITLKQKLTSEAQAILARGLSDTFETLAIVDAYSSRTATFTWDKAKSVEPAFPAFGADGWAEVTHKLMAVEESGSSPTVPLAIVLKL